MITKYLLPSFGTIDTNYPLNVMTVGRDIQHPIRRPFGIEHHQLMFTVSGKGKIVLNNKKIDMPENTLLYLKPYTPQQYFPVTDTWETIWVTYIQNKTFDIMDIDDGVYPLESIDKFIDILTEMISYRKKSNFYRDSSILLYKLLLFLNEAIKNADYYKDKSKIKISIDYIFKHYTEQIELKTLASLANMSPEHFCRVFKENMQLRPMEYINHLRIQEAKKRLILYPKRSIAKISDSTGFNSPSYFISLFKKHVGITPAEFRKTHID